MTTTSQKIVPAMTEVARGLFQRMAMAWLTATTAKNASTNRPTAHANGIQIRGCVPAARPLSARSQITNSAAVTSNGAVYAVAKYPYGVAQGIYAVAVNGDVSVTNFATLEQSFAFDRDFMDLEHSELGKYSKVAPIFAGIALLLSAIGLIAVAAALSLAWFSRIV